eukprot:12924000-Prorocentrum_lima.AAC.1
MTAVTLLVIRSSTQYLSSVPVQGRPAAYPSAMDIHALTCRGNQPSRERPQPESKLSEGG